MAVALPMVNHDVVDTTVYGSFASSIVKQLSLTLPVMMTESSVVVSETEAVEAATAQPLSTAAIVGIFVVGFIPYAVATVEFWRRIAVGASFGTGSDSVVFPTTTLQNNNNNNNVTSIFSSFQTTSLVRSSPTFIGQDNDRTSSRGRRILGNDALIAAYILFAVAGGVLGLVTFSLLTSNVPTDFTAELGVLP